MERHDATAVVPFDAVGQPESGMPYSDRFGPWFDLDGSEIIPLGTEAVEGAVELLIGAFQLWSDLPKIDGTSVAIDFPLLTQLIQQDWDRVMGGEDGQLPGKGSSSPTTAAPPRSAAFRGSAVSGRPRAAPGRVLAAGSCGGCPGCRAQR
jgi:hypothetical protein